MTSGLIVQDGFHLPVSEVKDVLESLSKLSKPGWNITFGTSSQGFTCWLVGGYCEMDLGKGVVLPAGHTTPGLSVSKNICGTRVHWVGQSGNLPNNLGFPAIWIKSLLCLSTCGCVIWSLLLCHERNFLREVFWHSLQPWFRCNLPWLFHGCHWFCVSKVIVFMTPLLCGDVPYEN